MPMPMPNVGLFIPCYVDQCYPDVGLATVELLERFGCSTDFPRAQTCCGQPMANAGCMGDAKPLAVQFLKIFRDYEYVVAPSGSCVAMVRHHYEDLLRGMPGYEELRRKTFELCEFLVDVLQVGPIPGRFPRKVGFHQSCHGLRELRLAKSSELMIDDFSKTQRLLSGIEGLTLVELKRPDECCGFGGTFSVFEEAVSCMMGQNRIHDHEQAGAEIIASNDMSCLMHLDGLLRRARKPIQVMHVAEILAQAGR